jgi:Arc/MetJ family transcription regulator
MNLDRGLVGEAASILGTHGATATVHAAMRNVVEREARRRLVKRDLASLTPEAVEEMRRPRSS